MRIEPTQDREMARTAGCRTARRPWLQLLTAVLELADGKAELLRHAERPWASVTFTGTRHTIALSFTGAEALAAGESFIAALPDHEFTISRQLVADAAIIAVDQDMADGPQMTVEAELLLVADP